MRSQNAGRRCSFTEAITVEKPAPAVEKLSASSVG